MKKKLYWRPYHTGVVLFLSKHIYHKAFFTIEVFLRVKVVTKDHCIVSKTVGRSEHAENLLTTLAKWPHNSKNFLLLSRENTLYLHKPMDTWRQNHAAQYLHCKPDFQPLLWPSSFNAVNIFRHLICCSLICMCWLSCSLWHLLFLYIFFLSHPEASLA